MPKAEAFSSVLIDQAIRDSHWDLLHDRHDSGTLVAPDYRSTMHIQLSMSKYEKGDYVKIEVTDEKSGDREWIWLLVSSSDDRQQLVFGQLDSEPNVAANMTGAEAEWCDSMNPFFLFVLSLPAVHN